MNINSLVEYAHENNPDKKIVLLVTDVFHDLSYIEQYASNIDACILSGTNDQQPSIILNVVNLSQDFRNCLWVE